MKKLFIFLFIFIAFTPITVLADVADQCQNERATCVCTTSVQTINQQVSSVQQCVDYCGQQGFNVTYSIRCENGTTIDQGAIDRGTEQVNTRKDPPALNVQIPGLTFTAATFDNGFLTVNYIGEYIAAAYPYLLSVGALIAVVFMIIAGMQWILARGDAGAISKAKGRITNATTGLVLLFFAYTIAFFIDPGSVRFDSLKLSVIPYQEIDIPPYGEFLNITPRTIPENTVPIEGTHLINGTESHDPYAMHADALVALNAAADEFFERTKQTGKGYNILISSTTRTLQNQATTFYNNCLTNNSKSCTVLTCNPAAGSSIITGNSNGYTLTGSLANETDKNTIIQTLVENAKIGNCPHTSTIAIDAWCPKNKESGYKYNPECQYQLEQAMLNNGWCRLQREPWHFELQKYSLSDNCLTTPSTTYTNKNGNVIRPSANCTQWGYREEKCLKE